MRFFIMIIILLLFVYRPQIIQLVQLDHWVDRWKTFISSQSFIQKISGRSFLLSMIIFLLPVFFVVLILLPLIEHRILGVFYFLLLLVLLAFSIGGDNIKQQFEYYLSEWNEGRGKHALDEIYTETVAAENDKEVHLAARSGLIYNAFKQLFCVLFWFVATGVMIPVIYKMLMLFAQEEAISQTEDALVAADQEQVSRSINNNFDLLYKIIKLIEFIPSLLVSLVLNLFANKKLKGFSVIKHNALDLSLDTKNVLHQNAIASLDLKPIDSVLGLELEDDEQRNEFYQSAVKEMDVLSFNFQRLLVTFLVVSAVWVIIAYK